MEQLVLAFVISSWLVIEFAWLAFLVRLRKGRFQILRDDAQAFTARTDFGHLTLDRVRGVLRYQEGVQANELPLSAIQRLDFGLTSRWAVGEEFFLTSFDVWDVFERYRDRVNWYQLSLVRSHGKPIPLFIVGQYEPREPLVGWWFEFQASLLGRLGFFAAADERAREILERLQMAFRESGWEITLAAARSKEASATIDNRQLS